MKKRNKKIGRNCSENVPRLSTTSVLDCVIDLICKILPITFRCTFLLFRHFSVLRSHRWIRLCKGSVVTHPARSGLALVWEIVVPEMICSVPKPLDICSLPLVSLLTNVNIEYTDSSICMLVIHIFSNPNLDFSNISDGNIYIRSAWTRRRPLHSHLPCYVGMGEERIGSSRCYSEP